MAKDREIIARLLQIFQILRLNPAITVDQLQDRLGTFIEKRTLQRTMKALEEDPNCPVERKWVPGKGREYAYFISPQNKKLVPMNSLTTEEALLGKLIIQGMGIFKDTPLEEQLDSFEAKFSSLIPETVFTDVDRKMQALEHTFETFQLGTHDYSRKGGIIMDLLKALLERKKCVITYFSQSSGKSDRYTVCPLKLVQYKGALYLLLAFDESPEIKVFAVHRMEKAEVLEEKFQVTDGIKQGLKNREQRTMGIYDNQDLKPQTVVLTFDKDIASQIMDRKWHATQDIKKNKDGSVTMTLEVAIENEELISWILWWQTYVEVVRPKALREEIKKRAGAIGDIY